MANFCLHPRKSGHMTSPRHTYMTTSTPPLGNHSKHAGWHGISGCLDSNPDEGMPTMPRFGWMTPPPPLAPIVNTDTTRVSTVMSHTARIHTLLSTRGRLHGQTPLRPLDGGQLHTDLTSASPSALVCPSDYSAPRAPPTEALKRPEKSFTDGNGPCWTVSQLSCLNRFLPPRPNLTCSHRPIGTTPADHSETPLSPLHPIRHPPPGPPHHQPHVTVSTGFISGGLKSGPKPALPHSSALK